MKKLLNGLSGILIFTVTGFSQPTIYPAPENNGIIFITHATIHVGNGKIINDGTIEINKQKIEKIGTGFPIPADAKIFDVKGEQVYPGLISSITNLGLKEVADGVRGTNDYQEIGNMNPSIRSIVAYNTDSRVINILRSMGILFANIIPQDEDGSRQLISGTSSVVQLDAWNYEDAAYKMDGQMHFNMPSLIVQSSRFSSNAQTEDPVKQALEQIESVKSFFKNAKAYLAEPLHKETNLNYEATKNLFDKKQKLFVHCNAVKEMLLAIDFVKEFGFDVVIVGGADSWQIAPLLKQNNIAVILFQSHVLPMANDDDIDQPFKTPYLLQKAGVLFAIADNDGTTRGRNLMFNAGSAASYGLTKEEALSAITFNPAKILDMDKITGTLEEGKDANIIISEGDILDMEHSIVNIAFIQGRKINLDNRQTQLAERYIYKYGLK
ncbi:MAG: amidohydrolase family protein [Bacteroidota bacterium]|nr:amidohydrolase family protein [Bacteroidota bacterium]